MKVLLGLGENSVGGKGSGEKNLFGSKREAKLDAHKVAYLLVDMVVDFKSFTLSTLNGCAGVGALKVIHSVVLVAG